MPFFDFHIHPTLKSMFSKEVSKTSPWANIDVGAIPWVVRWCSDFQYILCSQSNLAQLLNMGCNLVCIALIAPERGMTKNDLINRQAKGTLSRYLDPDELKRINDPNTSPYQLVLDDLQHVLLNPQRFGIVDKKVVLLKKGVVYAPDDRSTLYIALTVEGAHSLGNTFDSAAITADSVIANLIDLTVTRGFPIVSFNLTHLEQYPFCNHAFGILFVGSGNFNPTGKMISTEGISIIKECYRHGIMIDIKHMSLGARRLLIERLRQESDMQAILQPLVCTHTGFTGLSYADIPDYIAFREISRERYSEISWARPCLYGSADRTAFNPSSINLFNEDILAVLRSGGMIGLSLDKRILGYSEASNDPGDAHELTIEKEYISNDEKQFYLAHIQTGAKMSEAYCITHQEILDAGIVNPNAAYYHLCHFMSHILHLIKVAGEGGYDVNQALLQVCIGSDFDGLINPVWCCPTIDAINQFKNDFISSFPHYAKANRDSVSLPNGFNVHAFADRLFFTNGKDFLLKRLASMD